MRCSPRPHGFLPSGVARLGGFGQGNLGVDPTGEGAVVSEQTEDDKDYAKGSEEDQKTDAPTGKEGTTPGDETLPDDQATFQPESS